jgi:hypothetical protein
MNKKSYLKIKVVEAEPMNEQDYFDSIGYVDSCSDRNGYFSEGKWYTKKEFEKCNVPIDNLDFWILQLLG